VIGHRLANTPKRTAATPSAIAFSIAVAFTFQPFATAIVASRRPWVVGSKIAPDVIVAIAEPRRCIANVTERDQFTNLLIAVATIACQLLTVAFLAALAPVAIITLHSFVVALAVELLVVLVLQPFAELVPGFDLHRPFY
jgi:hypothetical protein